MLTLSFPSHPVQDCSTHVGWCCPQGWPFYLVNPHKHAQMLVSWATPDSVNLTTLTITVVNLTIKYAYNNNNDDDD